MKNITTIILLSLFCTAIGAQNKGAVIEFKQSVHDFGTIQEKGGSVSYNFEFTNKGSAPLVINNVEASCGCTTPEWTKAPVASGKKGSIKVTYNPDGRPYPFDKTITVSTNAGNPVILTIKGNVEQKQLTIEEQYPYAIGSLRMKNSIISMARMQNTATHTETMEIMNNGTRPVIVSFEKVPEYIRIEANPISIGAKQKGTIKCTYIASQKKDIGPVSDVITMKVNNDKGAIEVQATLETDISKLTQADLDNAPVVTIKNASVDLGALKQGQQANATFELTNSGKSDLIIHKLTPNCKCIQASANPQTIKPGQTTTIKAQLDTKGEEGNKFYTITATTNSPRQQILTLFISANITK